MFCFHRQAGRFTNKLITHTVFLTISFLLCTMLRTFIPQDNVLFAAYHHPLYFTLQDSGSSFFCQYESCNHTEGWWRATIFFASYCKQSIYHNYSLVKNWNLKKTARSQFLKFCFSVLWFFFCTVPYMNAYIIDQLLVKTSLKYNFRTTQVHHPVRGWSCWYWYGIRCST